MSATAVPTAETFGDGVTTFKPEKTKPVSYESDDGPPKKDDDDDGEKMEGDDMADWKACAKAIESGKISLEGIEAIQAAIDSRAATVQEPEPEAAPAAAPGGEAMKAEPAEMSAKMAAQQGEIDGLKIREKEREAAEACAVDVRAAMKRLDGVAAGDLEALEGRLLAFREKCGSTELFTTYVDALANSAPVEEGAPTALALKAQTGANEVAMKYMDKGGTGAVDKAARFCADYDELKAHGVNPSQTKDRWVELSMERATAQEI